MTDADLDRLFEILANERRRRVIAYLDESDDEVATVSELVDHVADDPTGESTDERERIAVSFHHNHLPKLGDGGIVDYDPRSQMVRYRGSAVVSEWIELARSHETDFSNP